MRTNNGDRKNAEQVNVVSFMNYFNRFSKKQQSRIAEQINETTFRERWIELDKELSDINMSEEEILNEVSTVRNGKRQKKNSA